MQNLWVLKEGPFATPRPNNVVFILCTGVPCQQLLVLDSVTQEYNLLLTSPLPRWLQDASIQLVLTLYHDLGILSGNIQTILSDTLSIYRYPQERGSHIRMPSTRQLKGKVLVFFSVPLRVFSKHPQKELQSALLFRVLKPKTM